MSNLQRVKRAAVRVGRRRPTVPSEEELADRYAQRIGFDQPREDRLADFKRRAEGAPRQFRPRPTVG